MIILLIAVIACGVFFVLLGLAQFLAVVFYKLNYRYYDKHHEFHKVLRKLDDMFDRFYI